MRAAINATEPMKITRVDAVTFRKDGPYRYVIPDRDSKFDAEVIIFLL